MIFMFDRLLQLAEAERPDCRLLILGIPYRALNIFYTQCCHCFSLLLAATTAVALAAATIAAAVTTTTALAATSFSTLTTTASGSSPAFASLFFTGSARCGSLFGCGCVGNGKLFSTFLTNKLGNCLTTTSRLDLGRAQFAQAFQAGIDRI
jgi:hypothetical protein